MILASKMNLGIDFEQSGACRRFDRSAFDLPGGWAVLGWGGVLRY
jgi:hypothetical protein